MGVSLLGTTIVHMERLFASDTATMSWTFTGHAFGQLVGTALTGLIYDRLLDHELLFAVSVLVEALTTIAAPFVTNLFAYFVVTAVTGATRGIIGTGL